MKRAILMAVIGGAMMAFAGGAQAAEVGFQLCNRTNTPVVYAKGLNVVETGVPGAYTGKEPLVDSDGWHSLAPGDCDVLWPGALKYRYYLIYAEAPGTGRVWSGDQAVCVEKDDFKIRAPFCPAGREQRDFIQIDTGDDYSFTYDLE